VAVFAADWLRERYWIARDKLRPLCREQCRIDYLEARLDGHERALAAAFELADVGAAQLAATSAAVAAAYRAAGLPVPVGVAAPDARAGTRDRHGLHSVDGGAA
jgi:hypothetical protein